MLKKTFFYACLIAVVAGLSSGFKPMNSEKNDWFFLKENESNSPVFPSERQVDYLRLNIPFTGKFFIGYKEAIAFQESQGKYKKVNSSGYMGKYQFGTQTLKSIGIKNTIAFLNSPRMQEKAFVALLSKNKWELKDEIDAYEGTIINGVTITESGILAAAHLGGVGSVKRFLSSKGKRVCKDSNGASVVSYMRDFGGYETSGIIAESNATIK
ncbi:MAG: peptidoglycan-binding protein LysM [Bacteroidota bacterium]